MGNNKRKGPRSAAKNVKSNDNPNNRPDDGQRSVKEKGDKKKVSEAVEEVRGDRSWFRRPLPRRRRNDKCERIYSHVDDFYQRFKLDENKARELFAKSKDRGGKKITKQTTVNERTLVLTSELVTPIGREAHGMTKGCTTPALFFTAISKYLTRPIKDFADFDLGCCSKARVSALCEELKRLTEMCVDLCKSDVETTLCAAEYMEYDMRELFNEADFLLNTAAMVKEVLKNSGNEEVSMDWVDELKQDLNSNNDPMIIINRMKGGRKVPYEEVEKLVTVSLAPPEPGLSAVVWIDKIVEAGCDHLREPSLFDIVVKFRDGVLVKDASIDQRVREGFILIIETMLKELKDDDRRDVYKKFFNTFKTDFHIISLPEILKELSEGHKDKAESMLMTKFLMGSAEKLVQDVMVYAYQNQSHGFKEKSKEKTVNGLLTSLRSVGKTLLDAEIDLAPIIVKTFADMMTWAVSSGSSISLLPTYNLLCEHELMAQRTALPVILDSFYGNRNRRLSAPLIVGVLGDKDIQKDIANSEGYVNVNKLFDIALENYDLEKKLSMEVMQQKFTFVDRIMNIIKTVIELNNDHISAVGSALSESTKLNPFVRAYIRYRYFPDLPCPDSDELLMKPKELGGVLYVWPTDWKCTDMEVNKSPIVFLHHLLKKLNRDAEDCPLPNTMKSLKADGVAYDGEIDWLVEFLKELSIEDDNLLSTISGFLVKHKLADNVNSLRPQIVIEDTEHEKDRKGSVNSEVGIDNADDTEISAEVEEPKAEVDELDAAPVFQDSSANEIEPTQNDGCSANEEEIVDDEDKSKEAEPNQSDDANAVKEEDVGDSGDHKLEEEEPTRSDGGSDQEEVLVDDDGGDKPTEVEPSQSDDAAAQTGASIDCDDEDKTKEAEPTQSGDSPANEGVIVDDDDEPMPIEEESTQSDVERGDDSEEPATKKDEETVVDEEEASGDEDAEMVDVNEDDPAVDDNTEKESSISELVA